MSHLWQDLRFGLRLLVKEPRVTVWAVLSLALGIGANTAIFSLVDALLLRPLPVADPSRLLAVHGTDEGSGATSVSYFPLSYPNFLDLRERSTAFSGLFAFRRQRLSFSSGQGEPELVAGQIVSTSYFEVLGVRPALGRSFTPGDDRSQGGDPVIVLGNGLWRRRFGSSPGIVGQSLSIQGRSYLVLGVAPPGFRGTRLTSPAEFWLPMTQFKAVSNRDVELDGREWQMFQVLGRLKPDWSPAQARASLEGMAARLREEHPRENAGLGLTALSLAESMIEPNQRRVFALSGAILMVAVGLVLLIACANVGNLLLARATGRRKEIAVRLAVGAARGRLVRQLLTESLVLALAAGALGIALAAAAVRLLWSLRPPLLEGGMAQPALDGRVLSFTLGLSLVTAVLCGLAPALQAARTDLNTVIKTGTALAGRSRHGLTLRDLLVAAQVALALIALAGAGLLLSTLRRTEGVDPGFRSDGLVTLSVHLQAQGYDEVRGMGFHERILQSAASQPAIRSVALSSHALLSEATEMDDVLLPGESAETDGRLSMVGAVSPGYFETLGIPLLAGRAFTGADRKGAPGVAIVNQTLAERLWPRQDAVGRRLRLAGQEGEWTVVGLARDSKHTGLGEGPQSYVYLPLAQHHDPLVALYARAEGPMGGALRALRRTVREADPALPLLEVGTVPDLVQRSLWAQRMRASLLALLGGLALLLAAVGIYAVAAYSVRQRRREIALRITLGANRLHILRIILRRGMTVVAAGMALGLGVVAGSTRWLEGLLFGVRATDPATLAGTALLLAAVALAANGLPAWMATRENPRTVLQSE